MIEIEVAKENEDVIRLCSNCENLVFPYIHKYDRHNRLLMQDFLEKAEKILTERMYFSDDEAKQFKNYMKNENKV